MTGLRDLTDSQMRRYFLFMVIHGFLIVTLSSSLVAAIPQITQNPGSAVTLLATYLPQVRLHRSGAELMGYRRPPFSWFVAELATDH